MSYTYDASTFSVPLSLTAHAQAERFCQHHSHPAKAKQVYLNTLAVYAVNFYLDCLAIDTDLPHSHSWNPSQQALLNTADLKVNHCGVLECRPVLPEAVTLEAPAETHQDRIGYVAVQLDADLRQATLLGFLPSVSTEQIPLDQLHSMEELVDHLARWAERRSVSPAPDLSKATIVPATQLGQWLQNVAGTSWLAIENAFIPQQFAFDFRGEPAEVERLPAVQRYKHILIDPETETSIQLAIGLTPLSEAEVEIWVQVSATDEQHYLPPHLHLQVLDEFDTEVMQAEARSTEAIRLRFTVAHCEPFSLKLTLSSSSVVESFVA